jgi:DNA-directed RNA polymerase II subunit RPB3
VLCTQVVVDNAEAYAFEGECLAKAEEMGKPGIVDIRQRHDQFVFKVESCGALPAEAIVMEAIGILMLKLQYLRTALKQQDDVDAMPENVYDRYRDRDT